MNPEDKYLNPREPPKPKPRLRTSPVLPQARDADWFLRAAPSAISKSTSQPASPTRERDNGSKPARSLSPPRSRGFFRHFNSSSPDVGNASRRDVNTGESLQGCAKSSGRGRDCHQVPRHSDNHCDLPSSTKVKRTPPNTDRLPFRQPPPPSNTEPMPLSIQDRRALKSRSRDGSPNKSVLRVETRLGNGKPFGERPKRNKRSPEAKDSSSPRKSSLLLNAAKKLGVSRNSTSPKSRHSEEKSLPTLPNSPSSVMDEALRDIGANERALDMEMLCSRFSDITATEESPASDSPREKSRFSKWSTDSDAASPESMTSSSTFNPDSHTSPIGDDSETRRLSKTPVPMDYNSPATPHSTGVSELSTPSSVIKKASIGLGLPYLSVSETSPQLDIPEISIDEVDHVESNPKRHAAFFGKEESIKALKMRSPDASATGFYGLQGDSEHPHGATDQHQTLDGFSNAQLQRQSAAMQELMDELSYLKNTIESGRGGSST